MRRACRLRENAPHAQLYCSIDGIATQKFGNLPDLPRLGLRKLRRSDDTVGRPYLPRGQTPIVPTTGRRFGCSMISAISNLGRLWSIRFSCRFNAAVFIRFLTRLLRSTDGRKIILIVDSHPAHKAAKAARSTFLISGTLNAQINSGLVSAFDFSVAGGTASFINEGLLRKTTSGTLANEGVISLGGATLRPSARDLSARSLGPRDRPPRPAHGGPCRRTLRPGDLRHREADACQGPTAARARQAAAAGALLLLPGP